MRDHNEVEQPIRRDMMMDGDPSEADMRFIEAQLVAYNIGATGYNDYRQLAVLVRDDGGTILAGLTGFRWGGTLKIEYLWVHEHLRGQGYGSRMIRATEQEAIRRDCRLAVVDTHSFQAPQFYPKRGYVQSTCSVALSRSGLLAILIAPFAKCYGDPLIPPASAMHALCMALPR